jgi:energy-coupling factor transporter transmembrane protein EcfT
MGMRIVKLFIALVLIVGIFGIVGLYSQIVDLGVVTTFFRNLFFQSEYLFYLYQIILFALLALLLITFLIIVFKPIGKKAIHIKKDTGQVNVPLHSLEAIAKSSLHTVTNTDNVQVNVTLNKQQLANVEVTVTDHKHHLFTTGKQIEEQVAQALKKMAMVETEKIKVIFKKPKVEADVLTGNKKETRVI